MPSLGQKRSFAILAIHPHYSMASCDIKAHWCISVHEHHLQDIKQASGVELWLLILQYGASSVTMVRSTMTPRWVDAAQRAACYNSGDIPLQGSQRGECSGSRCNPRIWWNGMPFCVVHLADVRLICRSGTRHTGTNHCAICESGGGSAFIHCWCNPEFRRLE